MYTYHQSRKWEKHEYKLKLWQLHLTIHFSSSPVSLPPPPPSVHFSLWSRSYQGLHTHTHTHNLSHCSIINHYYTAIRWRALKQSFHIRFSQKESIAKSWSLFKMACLSLWEIANRFKIIVAWSCILSLSLPATALLNSTSCGPQSLQELGPTVRYATWFHKLFSLLGSDEEIVGEIRWCSAR